jgi:hypothetical protein
MSNGDEVEAIAASHPPAIDLFGNRCRNAAVRPHPMHGTGASGKFVEYLLATTRDSFANRR